MTKIRARMLPPNRKQLEIGRTTWKVIWARAEVARLKAELGPCRKTEFKVR